MRFVSSVESNVKRGCNVKLGAKTLIVGPTGAGKSTIVNAIELALTGRASDVAGRATLAKDQELATLIRAGDTAGGATVAFSDGGSAAWMLIPGTKSVHGGESHPDAFPLRDVRDNLLGSPETARKWLLNHVARGLEWAGVLAPIPTALHARISTLAGGLVLGLPTALETARSKAREESKRAEVLKTQSDVAATGLPPPLTEAEIEAAKLDATAQAREMLAQARERGRTSVARVEKLKIDVKAALDALAALPSPSTIADVGGAMLKVLDGQIETKAGACGICGGTTDALKATTRREHISLLIKAAAEAERKRAEATAALNSAKSMWLNEQATMAALAGEVGRLNALIDNAPEPSIVAERRGQWKAVQDQQAAALAAKRTSDEWVELAEALDKAVSRIVDAGRADFEARVQSFMPEGMIFGLDLAETSVRYGLRDGGHLRSALSGGEWAIVTAALAGAVIQPDRLNVIVPEDRPFDPATLAATMQAFGKIDAQVIITAPTMPTVVYEGWTVISVGGEIAKATAAPVAVAQAVTAPAVKPKKRGRGRPSNAEKAALAAAASAQSNEAPRDFVHATFPKVCAGCDVREDLPPELHSKACKIHGAGKVADVIIIKDGKRVVDDPPVVDPALLHLFE